MRVCLLDCLGRLMCFETGLCFAASPVCLISDSFAFGGNATDCCECLIQQRGGSLADSKDVRAPC